MGLSKFLRARGSLVGLDIGVGTLKVVELARSGSRTALSALGSAPTPEGVFEGSVVTNPKVLGGALSKLLSTSGVRGREVAIAVPGSSTFSKRLRMPRRPFRELSQAIRAEAAHFIPDDVAAVKLDFQVLGPIGENEVEVLVVAVREEVVDGFLAATNAAGVEVMVVDVDCFALQNCFEAGNPSARERTVGLIDVGSTVSSINICRGGNSLFTGDMSIGVEGLFEDLSRQLSLSWPEARDLACSAEKQAHADSSARDIIEGRLESLAVECSRQLNFYWKAAGTGDSIDGLVLSGGGACVHGLAERVRRTTDIPTEVLDPLKGVSVSAGTGLRTTELERPLLGVAMGLAMRESDDRITMEHRG